MTTAVVLEVRQRTTWKALVRAAPSGERDAAARQNHHGWAV